MNTIKIEVTSTEKQRLLHFMESPSDKTHWGNADAEIPEEKILKDNIIKSGSTVELSLFDVRLLTRYIVDVTDSGLVLLPEDASILKKLILNLYDYYQYSKKRAVAELESVSNAIDSLIRIDHDTYEEIILDHKSALSKIGPEHDISLESGQDEAAESHQNKSSDISPRYRSRLADSTGTEKASSGTGRSESALSRIFTSIRGLFAVEKKSYVRTDNKSEKSAEDYLKDVRHIAKKLKKSK